MSFYTKYVQNNNTHNCFITLNDYKKHISKKTYFHQWKSFSFPNKFVKCLKVVKNQIIAKVVSLIKLIICTILLNINHF